MAFLAKFLFFIAAFLAVDAQKYDGGVGGRFGSQEGLLKVFDDLQVELVKNINFSDGVDHETVSIVADAFKNVFSNFVDFLEVNHIRGVGEHEFTVVKNVLNDVSEVFGFVSDKFYEVDPDIVVGLPGKGRTGGGRHFGHGTY